MKLEISSLQLRDERFEIFQSPVSNLHSYKRNYDDKYTETPN